jgi:hypothetical protein
MNALTPSRPVIRNDTGPFSRSASTARSKNGQHTRSVATQSATSAKEMPSSRKRKTYPSGSSLVSILALSIFNAICFLWSLCSFVKDFSILQTKGDSRLAASCPITVIAPPSCPARARIPEAPRHTQTLSTRRRVLFSRFLFHIVVASSAAACAAGQPHARS